jgi:hypothetical protein
MAKLINELLLLSCMGAFFFRLYDEPYPKCVRTLSYVIL